MNNQKVKPFWKASTQPEEKDLGDSYDSSSNDKSLEKKENIKNDYLLNEHYSNESRYSSYKNTNEPFGNPQEEKMENSKDNISLLIQSETKELNKKDNSFQNLNFSPAPNQINEINNNNKKNDLISIDKLLNDSIKEEELEKLVKDNSDKIDQILNSLNNNIINDLVEADINKFKIELDKFILESKLKIEKLKALDDIQLRIKEKLIFDYELKEKIVEIKLEEAKKLREYEEKLDYVIMAQNQIIEKLQDINIELKNNLVETKSKDTDLEFNENELIKNISNTESNLNQLEEFIKNNVLNGQEEVNDLEKIINELKFDENTLFFEFMEKIHNSIKVINKEYLNLVLNAAISKNKED